ncbi:MAG: transcription initiation factor TFIID component TAF4 family-domain-containing protein [Benjaminiella poitrasii]|nr:MAG: transcription initiation factor TFIID component TAF4 family-domain-containing protein [Benjaminiella poitrasii]
MSAKEEGSNETNSQTQQQTPVQNTPPTQSQQQQQPIIHQELNFSINDIFNNNHDVNDSSFQSIVQTLSNNNNEEHITPSYAHLPAELQDLFNTNETDDLLSVQANHSDASLLQEDIATIWNNRSNLPTSQPFIQQENNNTLAISSPASATVPNSSSITPSIQAATPISITAAQFLAQAKSLLGQQQYQQLEDLKNKPSPLVQKPTAHDDDYRKRPLMNSPNNVEDAQPSIPGVITPQLKKMKTEHIPLNSSQAQYIQPTQPLQQMTQMNPTQPLISQPLSQLQPIPQQLQSSTQTPIVSVVQPSSQPMFKTPAVPNISGLQVPSKANVPPSSKPSAPNGPTTTTSANTGGGGDRIDYEALTDVMGYAGVDLKEEAEHFMKDGDAPNGMLPDGVDRSKTQDFMNTDLLREKILKQAKGVNIKEIDSDFVSYIALAAQDRLRKILEAMVTVSRHRTFDPFGPPPLSEDGHPLFKIQVKQNVKLQLDAIRKVSKRAEIDAMDDDKEMSPKKEEYDKDWYSNKSRMPLKIEKKERKVTIQDAIFVMERDVQGGRGTSQRTLLKTYNGWLC